MSDFLVKSVEDLCADGVLFSPMDGNHGGIHPKATDYVPTGIPFIMASDLINGQIDTKNCAFITPDQANRLRKGFSIKGDVLLTHKATIGRSAIVGNIDVPFIMLTPQVTYYRVKNPSILSNRYLYYYFNSKGFLDLFNQWSGAGSTRAYLGITGQKKLPVVVPPIEWQHHISEILGSLDDKIELNRQMNETLEAMAQAIFRDWFVDFGPTRRKLEGATDPIIIMGGLVQDSGQAQALADLFPAMFRDNGLPENWKEKQVGDVTVLLKRGLAPSYSDNGILVINQKCIRNKAVNLAAARRHDAAKRPAKDRLLEEYDVVVNSTGVGTLGRVATVRGLKEAATADSHVTICRANTSEVSKLILSLFMEGQEAFIETMGHGSTGQTELSPASLSAMVFPVAPEPVQLAFDNLVMPLRDLVTSNSEHSLTLAETRDLLLPKLISGEIRLGEAIEAAA